MSAAQFILAMGQALPNFPPQVLAGCMAHLGQWPPVLDDRLQRLERLLDAPVKSWRSLRWQRMPLDPANLSFAEETVQGLLALARTHARGEETFLVPFVGDQSRQAFWRHVRILLATGDFESAPVLLGERPAHLLDGRHRLAAYGFVHECSKVRQVFEASGTASRPLQSRPHFWVLEGRV